MLLMKKANNITDARNYLHIKFHYFAQKEKNLHAAVALRFLERFSNWFHQEKNLQRQSLNR